MRILKSVKESDLNGNISRNGFPLLAINPTLITTGLLLPICRLSVTDYYSQLRILIRILNSVIEI